jgi:hypothetical protein
VQYNSRKDQIAALKLSITHWVLEGPVIIILDEIDVVQYNATKSVNWLKEYSAVEYFLQADSMTFARGYTTLQSFRDLNYGIACLSAATARGFDIKFAKPAKVLCMVRPLFIAESDQFLSRGCRVFTSFCSGELHLTKDYIKYPETRFHDYEVNNTKGATRMKVLQNYEPLLAIQQRMRLIIADKLHDRTIDAFIKHQVEFLECINGIRFAFYQTTNENPNVDLVKNFNTIKKYLNLREEISP